MKISNEDKVSLKIIAVGVTLLVLLLLACFGIYRVIEEKTNFYKQPKQCISPRALEGCETTVFGIHHELERCEWAFKLCQQAVDTLNEKLQKKGEK